MSDESEDDYAEFGTPLEPLDEDACPRKKPFTIEEQFARDKHGRRRFHGAFTGGFSAGFLNTVGSLEGWQPSSFKSSKSEKGTIVVQKPEHFMDEEDMGEFGIAPSVLHAKEDFTNSINNKRKHSAVSSDLVFESSTLKNLLQPVRETIGIKLLRTMGWKPGQGTGPRISKHEKQRIQRLRKKVYGCALPDEKDDDSNSDGCDDDYDDEELDNITFAPNDYPFQLVVHKENLFGLGYKGLEKRTILTLPQREEDFSTRNRKTITGQAFGVGAFEEEDEDIYMREDMSQYDFSLDDGASKEKGTASGHIGSEDLFDEFALALKRTVKKLFPPPVLPKDFKPVHKVRVSRFEPLPANRDPRRLSSSPDRDNSSEEYGKLQEEAKKITESMPSSLSQSQGTFKPFVADPEKQSRYEKYLTLLAMGKKDEIASYQPITMTDWEKQRELVEFEQASKLFKPLTGVMEDRFTVASQPDNLNDPLAVVEKLKTGSDDEIQAAKMNMYGRLTRKVEDWKPSSLLCKRFNIPELTANEIPIVKTKPKYSIFDDLRTVKPEVEEPPPKVTEEEKPPMKDVQDTEEKEPDDSDKLVDAANKIDLFNAIFLDTDSEEEKEEEETAKEQENQRRDYGTPYEDNITNDKRNTSPPRGIFENLDCNILKPYRETSAATAETKEPEERDTTKSDEKTENPIKESADDVPDDLVYGPKLPDTFPIRNFSQNIVPQVHDGHWVEKTKYEYEKKKKKDKKYKKSKHKSKHKHKKKKK